MPRRIKDWLGGGQPRRRVPPTQDQICRHFKVPVTYCRFTVTFLDGTARPWAYRHVEN